MGRYDAAMKMVLQRWGFRIVEQVAGEGPARWHNIELPQVTAQYADLLFETASGQLWHIELQSSNDASMLARMLEYGTRVLRQRGRFPEQCVLYLGREPLKMETELRAPRVAYSYRLIDARELDGEALLNSSYVGDNILGILTDLRSSREAVQRILNAIAKLEPGDREAALKVLILFAGLRELEVAVEREASQMAVFEDILDNKVLGREYKRGLQEGIEKGLEQGLERGLEKGLEQGRRREVAMLRRQIAKRFGRIPRTFDARLNKMSPAELEALGERIIDARTLEELLL